MNQLINETLNDNNESIVFDTFEDIFLYVSKRKFECSYEELKELQNWLRQFYGSKWHEAVVYLNDSLILESVHCLEMRNSTDYTESKMQKEISENFVSLFPGYHFVKTEFSVPSGRIDILGEQEETGRPVIIELKMGKKNPTNQLLAYAHNFCDPILIGITQEEVDRNRLHENIIYFTYKEGKLEKYE